MTTTKNAVKSFLDDLRLKIDIFGIIYLRRDKNLQTLLDLDMSASSRTQIIKELKQQYLLLKTNYLGLENHWNGKKICKIQMNS